MRWYITPPNGEPVYEVELDWAGTWDALPDIEYAYQSDNSSIVLLGQFRGGDDRTNGLATVFTFAPGTAFTPKPPVE